MTMPDEEIRAIKATRHFLSELATGWSVSGDIPEARFTRSKFKRIPGTVREEARRILRHYPFACVVDSKWGRK